MPGGIRASLETTDQRDKDYLGLVLLTGGTDSGEVYHHLERNHHPSRIMCNELGAPHWNYRADATGTDTRKDARTQHPACILSSSL
jgi:hypothetical protein